jgi:hypothetical protein
MWPQGTENPVLLYWRHILIHLKNYEVVIFNGKIFSCIIWSHRISQVVLGLHTISLVKQNNVHKPSVCMREVDPRKCEFMSEQGRDEILWHWNSFWTCILPFSQLKIPKTNLLVAYHEGYVIANWHSQCEYLLYWPTTLPNRKHCILCSSLKVHFSAASVSSPAHPLLWFLFLFNLVGTK